MPDGYPDWEDAPGPDAAAAGGELKSGAVAAANLAEHVAALHADSDIGFSREYEEIQKFCAKEVHATKEHCSHPDNKCKNRYLNIVACELLLLV